VPSRSSRKYLWILLTFLALFIAGVASRRLADPYLRAMSVLLRFNNPQATGFGASFARHPFHEEVSSAQTPQGKITFRLYVPQDVNHPSAMVLLHGIHRLGMEEPRLVNFSRALAGAGIEVMTPELEDLADYQVTPRTIDVIGYSAVILSTRMNAPVGLMGLSFAGGMALLAAAKPDYADNIGFVVAVGAHDDMYRVARFFAQNIIQEPDGTSRPFAAHEYGVLVLAYSHLDHFFAPADMPAAREALRLWLWEEPKDAEAAAASLSPPGEHEFDELVHHHEQLAGQIMTEVENHREEMDAVSPHRHLAGLDVPVYLLHGSGDTVIPASETEWLAKDVPARDLKAVLISPALIHVDMEGGIPLSEKWDLVHFLGQVVKAADNLRH
jgi:dienelactone hydrolase